MDSEWARKIFLTPPKAEPLRQVRMTGRAFMFTLKSNPNQLNVSVDIKTQLNSQFSNLLWSNSGEHP